MIERVRRWLAAPRFADPEVDRVARTAYSCSLYFIAVGLIWLPIAYLVEVAEPTVPLVGFGGIGTLVLAAILARQGRARTSGFVLVGLLFVVTTVGVYVEGGLAATATPSYLAAVLATSLFFSAREATAAALLTTALLVGFWTLDSRGLLPPKIEPTTERYVLANLTLVAIVIFLVQQSVGRLREARRYLQEITDSTPHAIYVYDIKALRFVYANAGVASQFGFSGTPVEGLEGMQRVVHPEDMDRLREHIVSIEAADDDRVVETEYRVRAADESWRWMRDRARVFDRDPEGAVRQVLGVAEDITEVKAAEEALERTHARLQRGERLEALGQLAGGVAHDFNNHLTVILASAQAASRIVAPRPDDAELADLVDDISHAAQRSADLTRQLLAFSRRQLVRPRVLDLSTVLSNAERLLGRVLPENVELRTLRSEEPCPIKVDPSQIDQVIMNLALNARDAMPDGGALTIEVGLVELDGSECERFEELSPGSYVKLSVCDTGEGMDAPTLERIFEPLFTTKAHGMGTGFGLATVEAIVREAGGAIDVSSRPGQGTEFRLYFPCSGEAPAQDATARAGHEDLEPGNAHVLVVEDDALVRRLAHRSLVSLGYEVTVAIDGQAGLARFTEDPDAFDVVLTDVMMPNLSGLEMAQRMREIRSALPIVFMSGYAEDGATVEGLDERKILLNKPFTIEELEHSLRQAMRH